MMSIRAIFLILSAITSSGLSAARAPAPAGPPDIAFVKAGAGGKRQLMVAKEDGSGATAIYTSTRMLRPEMGSNGNVYFWDGGKFMRISTIGGAAQTLFDTFKAIPAPSDLSPDGSSLAWFSADAGTLFRYDIGSGDQRAVTPVTELLDLTFDRTGANIIFSVPVSTVDYELRIVPTFGGNSVTYGYTGRISSIDASHLDSTLVMTVNPAGGAPYLALWEPGLQSPVRIVDGYNGTYRCNDAAILYQRVVGGGSAVFRRGSGGEVATVAKPESIFPSYRQIC